MTSAKEPGKRLVEPEASKPTVNKVASARWSDLGSRALSAGVLMAVGVAEIWLGGTAFAALVALLVMIMVWELARMTNAPARALTPLVPAGLAGGALVLALWLPAGHAAGAALTLPALLLLVIPGHDRRLRAIYALLILVAGYALVDLRETAGPLAILWLVGVVVASDVLGYFVGRTLGGPKFWVRISPKKTWSGTIAGWVGAALVGLGFVAFAGGHWLLLPLSALLAFAGQLGDIGESWIKRRSGVKDASRVIPGHGGVLDRFDALIGAVVLVWALQPVLPLATMVAG